MCVHFLRLMKTEVVLKSEGFESETETVAFNENRSCIEIKIERTGIEKT